MTKEQFEATINHIGGVYENAKDGVYKQDMKTALDGLQEIRNICCEALQDLLEAKTVLSSYAGSAEGKIQYDQSFQLRRMEELLTMFENFGDCELFRGSLETFRRQQRIAQKQVSGSAEGEKEHPHQPLFDQYNDLKAKIGELGYNNFIHSKEVEEYREWLRNDKYKHRLEWFERQYPNGLFYKDEDGTEYGVRLETKKFLAEADAAWKGLEPEKKDPWISVEDDLPKKDGESSIYCLVIDTYWGIVVRPFNEAHHCWDGEDGDDYYTDAVGGKITHWMPLPEPPAATNQEGDKK